MSPPYPRSGTVPCAGTGDARGRQARSCGDRPLSHHDKSASGLGLFSHGEAGAFLPALLPNSGLRRDTPFLLRPQCTRTISAVPRAEKRFMSAMRIWISAVWRSGSLAAMRSPKAFRRASSPRCGFGRVSRPALPKRSAVVPGGAQGFVADDCGRAVFFPQSAVLADGDDSYGLPVDDSGVAAAAS